MLLLEPKLVQLQQLNSNGIVGIEDGLLIL